MSTDKEEYIESSVSLAGKFPRFELSGDANADVLVLFEPSAEHEVVEANDVEDDIGGSLELHFSKPDRKLAAIRFPGAAKRWKIERVSVRYEEERDMIYMRLRWFLRQEFSLEIDELEEDLVLDFDKKDRMIGFAVTNAQAHFNAIMLADMKTDNQWIKLASFSDDTASIETMKAAKKAKKQQKRLLAAEAARATATPSPAVGFDASRALSPLKSPYSVSPASPLFAGQSASSSSSSSSTGSSVTVPQQAPKKRRVYTGAKINLIPLEGIAATTNSDESQRTYFSNRFVRDLEWVLNFPFILGKNAQTSQTDEKPLPLVETPWADFGVSSFEFLADLDRNPEDFLVWIRERLTRSNNLGGYFTMLIEFLLSKSKTVKQVLPKYQMFTNEKRTVGDFDFLIQMKATPEKPDEEPWIHLEVGIKFYLLLEDESPQAGSEAFVGPHCTGDSLEKYITKTVRQLDLCKLDHVAQHLRAEGKFPAKSNFFLKGYVFFPLTPKFYEQEQEASTTHFYSGNAVDPFPVDYWVESSGWLFDRAALQTVSINDGPVAGWWVKYRHAFPYNEDGSDAADPSEANLETIRHDHSLEEDILLLDSPPMTLAKQEKIQYSMWTILNKMDYMAPLLVTPDRPDIQLLNYAALKRTVKLCFATNYRSLFVAEVIPYSRSQYKDCPNPLRVTHVEASRGFIVGDHWPKGPVDVIIPE